MNKKIGRLLRPNMGAYFVLLFGFAVATALCGQYVLAGIELAVLAVGVTLYLLLRVNRKKQLKSFLEKTVDTHTGVQYFFHQSGYAGGLSVLVDAEGKPLLYRRKPDAPEY